MEWKKSNISGAELEQKQQAYIKEALEMAKRSSAKSQEDEAVRAQEAAEKMAKEKAAAEKEAAEKAEAERRAEAARKAAEEKAAREKAEAERKATEEKAEAERKAAEEKAEAERKAAENAAAEAEKEAAENEAEDNAEELINSDGFAELIGGDDTEDKDADHCEEEQGKCEDTDSELIDTAQLAHTENSEKAEQNEPAPANFNQYINQHNKAQCNCPNCRRKRAMMQQ